MPRPDRPGVLYLSPSQWGTISRCEAQWHRNRLLDPTGKREESTRPQLIGKVLGEAQETLHLGGDWRETLAENAVRSGAVPGFQLPDPYPLVEWLAERYELWLPEAPGSFLMRVSEVPFDQPIIPGVNMRGYLDGLADYVHPEHPERNGLAVVEFKSSGRKDRFYQLEYETQTWTYMRAMRQLGLDIKGCVFDYTYVYEYVDTFKSPPEKNFMRLWVPWDDELGEHYQLMAERIAHRALDLTAGRLVPVEHISAACQYCPHLEPCLRPGRLAGHLVDR